MVAAALCLAIDAPSAGAQIEPRDALEPPDLLELTGHIGKPLPGETGGWNLVLGDRYKRHTFHFHLKHMRILNSGRLPMDILEAVEPYRPNFFLFPNSPGQMATLESAAPSDQVTISGYRRRGSRNILVTAIERSSPNAPIPSPTTP
jgi:hypothetical protein